METSFYSKKIAHYLSRKTTFVAIDAV